MYIRTFSVVDNRQNNVLANYRTYCCLDTGFGKIQFIIFIMDKIYTHFCLHNTRQIVYYYD